MEKEDLQVNRVRRVYRGQGVLKGNWATKVIQEYKVIPVKEDLQVILVNKD